MLTPKQLESFQALRHHVAQKLTSPTYTDPKMPGWHHQRHLRVEALLDEADQLQREVERLQALLAQVAVARKEGWYEDDPAWDVIDLQLNIKPQ